ncbi:MAG: phenylalanine--tRNA ligase subunit alpha, partial [Candidatus Gracilibacteria bacterium]
MLHTLQALEQNSLVQISALDFEATLIDLRNAILGKNGSLTELLKGVKDLSDEDKKTVGKAINECK